MRIEVKQEKPFKPIAIILDSQEEVDRLFSLGNHSIFAREMGLGALYDLLQPYREIKNAMDYHSKLHSLLK